MELFTGIALALSVLCAGVAFVFGLVAWRSSQAAIGAVAELKSMRGRLVATEHSANTLSHALRRLEGRVHAYRRHRSAPLDGGELLDEPAPPANGLAEVDPDFAAMQALQTAPNGAPGAR